MPEIGILGIQNDLKKNQVSGTQISIMMYHYLIQKRAYIY